MLSYRPSCNWTGMYKGELKMRGGYTIVEKRWLSNQLDVSFSDWIKLAQEEYSENKKIFPQWAHTYQEIA